MMEIVYVSDDSSVQKFEKLMCEQYSFPAIAFDDTPRKESLRKRFNARGLCSLTVLDNRGNVITSHGR